MMYFTERCSEETQKLQKNKKMEEYVREQRRLLLEMEAFMTEDDNEENKQN